MNGSYNSLRATVALLLWDSSEKETNVAAAAAADPATSIVKACFQKRNGTPQHLKESFET
jgi:hypothetical protein